MKISTYTQNMSKTMDGFTMACTGQGTLGSHTTSKLAFGHFSSSATFLLTPANLSTLLHSICCMSSFLSFYVQEYFFKVLHTEMTLERDFQVTHSPCLLGYHWENVCMQATKWENVCMTPFMSYS